MKHTKAFACLVGAAALAMGLAGCGGNGAQQAAVAGLEQLFQVAQQDYQDFMERVSPAEPSQEPGLESQQGLEEYIAAEYAGIMTQQGYEQAAENRIITKIMKAAQEQGEDFTNVKVELEERSGETEGEQYNYTVTLSAGQSTLTATGAVVVVQQDGSWKMDAITLNGLE